jgi:hypothetical protein
MVVKVGVCILISCDLVLIKMAEVKTIYRRWSLFISLVMTLNKMGTLRI